MAGEATRITREKYEAAIEAAAGTMRWSQRPGEYARTAVDAAFDAARVEVGETAEERRAAAKARLEAKVAELAILLDEVLAGVPSCSI